jgi:hypothetical protein
MVWNNSLLLILTREFRSMRFLAFALCLLAGITGNACAESFVKSAKSGESTMMHVYQSWTKDCQNKPGIVKVVSKPAHGTLKPTEVPSVIGVSRKNPEKTAHCKGTPTNGYRVDYISEPDFHGSDRFKIQFIYGKNNNDIDDYTVNVP